MSSTASEQPQTYTRQPGQPAPVLSDQELAHWRGQIQKAKADRRRFEPTWRANLAMAAGKMWLEWRAFERGGRFVLPPLRKGQQRVTVDKLTPLRQSVIGEMSMDDDRPQVLFRTDDLPTEDFAHVANDAVAAGWETEWLGDQVLADVKRAVVDLGTAAVRVRFDPTCGPARVHQVPHRDGQPILDPEQARAYVADRQANGQSADLRTIHEGRICWDYGTPFNLLPPPGVKREDKFPYDCWVEPVPVDRIKSEYGPAAANVKAEAIDDLNTQGEGETAGMAGADWDDQPTGSAKLADHAFVYTIYERPNSKQPDGRVLVFAGADLTLVQVRPQLDMVGPDGSRRSGVHYFHYVRLTDRFWSRSLIDLAKGGQKLFNRRRSQISETIDRGQAFILADERAIPKRVGVPVEVIPVKAGYGEPTVSSGIPVGQWMYQELEQLDKDIQAATGLQDVLQGENPQNVGNYSQLALLQEQAGRQFDVVMAAFKLTVGHLVEDCVCAIRSYWGHDKLLAVEGPDGTLKAFTFDATKWPSLYRVYIARGAAQPRSQAAELKKIDDLAAYSINSGQPLPIQWVSESYQAGKPVDLPQQDRHDDLDKALYENQQLEQGVMPQVEYYQDHALHVQIVRSLQMRADAAGNEQLSAACEQHALAHLQQAQANAQAQAVGQQPQNVTGPPPGQGAAQTTPQEALLLALARSAQPAAVAQPPEAAQGIPNPYSIFPGSASNGRSGFGL